MEMLCIDFVLLKGLHSLQSSGKLLLAVSKAYNVCYDVVRLGYRE